MSEQLPTGFVTFLLTDIEGSTRAWQSARAGLAASIQRHYELLDRWVRRCGGARPEEQGEGDSVVAVFPDAGSALTAAVGAQQELLRELPDLPVRMALHSGDATLRDERNYVGLTVITCARIRSCGHGGQILVSGATVEAIGDRVPDGVGVRALGRYGLKGLSGRTPISQVVAPGLPDSFPPLQAGTSAAGNLPRPVSSFVGRRGELAELTAAIEDARWSTVTGEAGVGKSRLALAAAAAGADSHPGGVWWVALGTLDGDTADDVAAAIADACSIERRGRAIDDVTSFFGSLAAALLVLDGADAVSAATSTVARHLLTTTGELRIVVTCREPVGVAGETPFQLEPFAPPVAATVEELASSDAGELFLDRFRGAGGTESLTPGEVAEVVRICERWRTAADLEMVAIRAATTPVPELADELEQLGTAASSAFASSASWHLRDLGDAERLVLQRCSVFRRPMRADAALAVAEVGRVDAATAQSAIALLTERRVLRDDGERLHLDDRFRQVIGTWKPDDDLAEVVERYVAWCTSVAERFDTGGVMLPASWLADDLTDLMSAVGEACERQLPDAYRLLRALAPRWHELDRWSELWAASSWLASRSPSDGELAWVAAVSRVSFAAAGRPDAAVHGLRDEALAVATLDRDEVSCDYLSFAPSAVALADGDPSPALALFDAATRHGVEPVALAIATRLLATVEIGRHDELATYLDERSDGAALRDPITAAHHADRRDHGNMVG